MTRTLQAFHDALNRSERQLVESLDSPLAIQRFLDDIAYSKEPIYRSPLRVLKDRCGHCFDGAVFAAAMLARLGRRPMILEMLPNDRDDDHILAIFEEPDGKGVIAKSNFVGLRWREPIHRTLREIVLSYFEDYYNTAGEKTLVGFTDILDLGKSRIADWMTDDRGMDAIAAALDRRKRHRLVTPKRAKLLAPVDERRLKSGLYGADPSGLFKV